MRHPGSLRQRGLFRVRRSLATAVCGTAPAPSHVFPTRSGMPPANEAKTHPLRYGKPLEAVSWRGADEMPAELGELKVRDATISVHRAGRGPTVLFLHGAGGVPQWLPFFDALAER